MAETSRPIFPHGGTRRAGCFDRAQHDGDVTARDGEQAYKLVRKHAFSAVILDVSMPKASGIKVLQLMRRSSRLKDIPVMLITGNLLKAKGIQDNSAVKLANVILTKPFNTRDLIKQVKTLVNSGSSKSEKPPEQPPQRSRI